MKRNSGFMGQGFKEITLLGGTWIVTYGTECGL
jgi:hypothetical protein